MKVCGVSFGVTQMSGYIFLLVAAFIAWYALVLIVADETESLFVTPNSTQRYGLIFALIISSMIWAKNVLVIRGSKQVKDA